MNYLEQLPKKGWGVLRNIPNELVLAYWSAGYIKVQVVTGLPGVWQARLTAAGRNYRREQR